VVEAVVDVLTAKVPGPEIVAERSADPAEVVAAPTANGVAVIVAAPVAALPVDTLTVAAVEPVAADPYVLMYEVDVVSGVVPSETVTVHVTAAAEGATVDLVVLFVILYGVNVMT